MLENILTRRNQLLLSLALLVVMFASRTLPLTTAQSQNLALGRPAFASSVDQSDMAASNAVDGNTQTRWSSTQRVDPQWIYVDLGQTYPIQQIVLRWEAYAESYRIEFSNDATNWTIVSFQEAKNGGVDIIPVSGAARYVRIFGLTRGQSGFGYSLFEFEVYSQPIAEIPPPKVRPPTPQPDGNTLFFDDFENGSAKPDWNFLSGNWNIVDGTLETTVPCGTNGLSSAVVGNSDWKDYEVQFDFRGVAGSIKQFQFRYVDASSTGRYVWEARSVENDIGISAGGQAETLVPYQIQQGDWYRVRIRVIGEHIQVFVDDQLVLDRTDAGTQRLSGGIGPFIPSGTVNCPFQVQYDNVFVAPVSFPPPSATAPPIATGFQWPEDSHKVRYFAYGAKDKYCPNGGVHNGTDFDVEGVINPPVYAVADGKVLYVRNDPAGYGHYIMIWHKLADGSDVFSLYAHLKPDSILVEEGDPVHRGKVIALQDTDGAGANHIEHLHFEMKRTNELRLACPLKETANLKFFDPAEFISGHWWQTLTHAETAAAVTSTIATEVQNTQSTINPAQQTSISNVPLQGLKKLLTFSIDFPGSTLEVTVYRPNGTVYGKYLVSHPPTLITIPDPVDGNWGYSIRAVEVPFSDYPYAVSVGTRTDALLNVDSDSANTTALDGFVGDLTPPTTTIALNPQNAVGIYNQPVEVTLSAEDNVNGEGVALTLYSVDGGISYQTYTSPFTINTEGANTIYFYSQDGVGNSEAIQTNSFTIDTTPPDIPDLIAPADQALVRSDQLTFRWSNSTDAVRYELRLDDFNLPTTIVANTTATTFIPPNPLTPKIYYWQVRVIDFIGNMSDWSPPFGVTVFSPPNVAPPHNYYTTDTPTLTWNRVNGAATYEIQVNDTMNFTAHLYFRAAVSGDTLSVMTDHLPDGTYYWHVRACPVSGSCGAWSPTESFVVDAP